MEFVEIWLVYAAGSHASNEGNQNPHKTGIKKIFRNRRYGGRFLDDPAVESQIEENSLLCHWRRVRLKKNRS